MKKVSVIGSGFAGMAAAAYLAKQDCEVTVFEKNAAPGGRARHFSEQGFTFDMGPSWYWMPDIFERFFNDFGKSSSDYYSLIKLDPGFQIFFGQGETLSLPVSQEAVFELFESIEKGSAARLRKFLEEGAYKYMIGMRQLAYQPSLSWREFANFGMLLGAVRTQFFRSMRSHVKSYFKNEKLIKLMEFPVLFLGAMPDKIPALYSLMNYSAITQGTFYPQGGMFKIVDALHNLATSLDVKFEFETPVKKLLPGISAVLVCTNQGIIRSDAVVAAADYHHVDRQLLGENDRSYSEKYWDKKTLAPSCLIFFVGVNKKIKNLIHHNLFFDSDFNQHARQIYDHPEWPADPLFYVCCPSKTDNTVAPEGMENLFILVPVAPGLEDKIEIRERYFNVLIQRIEKETGDTIAANINFTKSYCINDFKSDYNSFKGNAYGLANTLTQTAFLKPSARSRKIENLFYAGQLTVPGPGVPPALISGKIAAQLALNYLNNKS